MVRTGQIPRRPRHETHSSRPKVALEAQDAGVSVPGGVFGQPASATQGSPEEAPPAYSVSEASDLIGASGGPAGGLGYASAHGEEGARRRGAPMPGNDT